MKIQLIFSFLFGFTLLGFAQKKPMRILLENATVHIGTGEVIQKGLIGIEGNQIKLVRNALAYTYKKSDWDTIIDVNGQHVYPGFIAPNSTLGITEIDAVRATRDFDEVGIFNPHVRTLIAYNCESEILETVRTNGVLITQSTPRGGVISGTSSILGTDCWNWEDGVIEKEDGIHLNWPRSIQGAWWRNEPKKRSEKYPEQKSAIYSFFEQARAYIKSEKVVADLRFEAMKGCFGENKRVYVHADELQQIQDVIDFAAFFELKHVVIVGGYDSYLIVDKLKVSGIPVMLPRLHMLPESEDQAIDLPFQLPFILNQGGVLFCLQNEGDMEAMNARNLPFLAGTAMAYGLSEEEALKSITLNTAKILGVDKKLGSIEEGKLATLYVSKGPALDMRTNQASVILINGIFVPTDNFQTDLYLKYKHKYGL